MLNEPPRFRRALGSFDAVMVVIGGMIGAGIFINSYIVAQRVPTPSLVLITWVVGGVIALAGAFAIAELGSLFPRAGGPYIYLRQAYHPFIGFLYGWSMLLMVQSGAIAAISLTFAHYTLRFMGSSAAPLPLAIAAIVVVSAVNYLGVKTGSRVLNVLVILKLAALAALILGATFLPESPLSAATAQKSSPTFSPLAFGSALVPVMFAYGGWQSANWIAEEIRDPQRTLPRALIIGTLVVVLVYVLVNVAYLRALGHAGLAATTIPAADTAASIMSRGGDRIISLAIAISTFGFLNLTVLAPTRVYWAMAADGIFFRQLAMLHTRFRTPAVAIVAQSSWGIMLAVTGSYAELVDMMVFADWLFFGLAVAAVVIFRRRIPISTREPGTYAAPGYPIIPILFVLAATSIVISVIWTNPVRSGMGALLLAIGMPAYIFWSRKANASREDVTQPKAGE